MIIIASDLRELALYINLRVQIFYFSVMSVYT